MKKSKTTIRISIIAWEKIPVLEVCEKAQIYEDELNEGTLSIDEIIDIAIEEYTTWTANQWEILKTYCTPEEADLNEALSELYEDVWNCLDLVDEEWEETEEELHGFDFNDDEEVTDKEVNELLGYLEE